MSFEEQADAHVSAASEHLPDPTPDLWQLRLYVSGDTPRCLLAYANLRSICEQHLADRYVIEIVDLLEHPLLARDEGIVAVPTLVRLAPMPVRTIIGDLSDTGEVLEGLRLGIGRAL